MVVRFLELFEYQSYNEKRVDKLSTRFCVSAVLSSNYEKRTISQLPHYSNNSRRKG